MERGELQRVQANQGAAADTTAWTPLAHERHALQDEIAKVKRESKTLRKEGSSGSNVAEQSQALQKETKKLKRGLKHQFVCATQGSRCNDYWGSAERTARGYTRRSHKTDMCGSGDAAAKMLFKEDPYNQADGPYDPEFKGHTMMDVTYKSTGVQRTTVMERFNSKPKKYGPEQDSAPFTNTDWMSSGGCDDHAPTCIAGFNYDTGTNVCADSANGWNINTPASACGYAQHKCTEIKVYLWPGKPDARSPTSQKNINSYASNRIMKIQYTYTYALKKWMECNAKFVNTTSGRAVPYGFNCNVEKRCTCLSCTKGSGVADEGAPCSCSDIPDSVQGKAAARCAQT